MKRLMLLCLSLLFTIVASAQIIDTTVPITGLGEFALGMSSEEMIEVLEYSKSNDSKIAGIFDGESSLSITNLKCFGYLFNECYFTFTDNKLTRINISIHFDKKNKDPEEFEELLSMLEDDYGLQPNKVKDIACIWKNEDKTKIMLYANQQLKN